MISEALQTTLAGIIPNTFYVMGDEKIPAPYCVHREVSTPFRQKAGLSHYEWTVEIVIIDDSPDTLETYVNSIITAVEALAGTTVSGTIITSVYFEGNEPDFDTEDKLYTNILRFTIETSNR